MVDLCLGSREWKEFWASKFCDMCCQQMVLSPIRLKPFCMCQQPDRAMAPKSKKVDLKAMDFTEEEIKAVRAPLSSSDVKKDKANKAKFAHWAKNSGAEDDILNARGMARQTYIEKFFAWMAREAAAEKTISSTKVANHEPPINNQPTTATTPPSNTTIDTTPPKGFEDVRDDEPGVSLLGEGADGSGDGGSEGRPLAGLAQVGGVSMPSDRQC